jgi:microcystin-dependent protein
MGTITGLTADAMQAIADSSVVSGTVDGSGHLILTTSGGSEIDAGAVVGPTGATGPAGPTAPAPTGSIMMFGSSTPPSGWVLCDGSALSRTTYSALFAILGTHYGSGDGSTTFNVPDMRNRFAQHDTTAMGSKGGSGTHPHTHTVPSHAHTLSGGNPEAIARITMNSGKVYMQKDDGADGWQADTNVDISGSVNNVNTSGFTSGARIVGNSKTGGSGNTGSDSTSTLPPYLNVAYIIKT